MTIALETELVGSDFDPKTQLCSYTIGRNGKHWTIKIPLEDIRKLAKPAKRKFVANKLESAMRGLPDENPTLRR